ncbi:hypothetical protein CSKR_104194 [Clonorchis sinensis]|uniref:Uncharacterized protein n=1 Tax=Clonorchis sinensis TaxID=79923 RepID=A0A3R7DB45_CLOSI|nr:hypothetical protein CSKR_104194 [Clonorchis sinensis]
MQTQKTTAEASGPLTIGLMAKVTKSVCGDDEMEGLAKRVNGNRGLKNMAGRGNKVKQNRYGIAGLFGPFWDPVVVDHRLGGVDNSQPGCPNQALPKFSAWENEGLGWDCVARYKTQPGLVQHQQQQTEVSSTFFISCSEPPAMADVPVLPEG